jgi:hypothetical protein
MQSSGGTLVRERVAIAEVEVEQSAREMKTKLGDVFFPLTR